MHFPLVDWIDSHRQFDLNLSMKPKRSLCSKLQAIQSDCIYQLTGHIYSELLTCLNMFEAQQLLLAVGNEIIFRSKLHSCL